MSKFGLCVALVLGLGFPAAAADIPAEAPLRKGDALLIRIEGVGGGIPEYREIVDSDGNVEMPYLGFLSAAGKRIEDLEIEMAKAYAPIATGTVVHVTFVTHFEPPPARQTLVRSEDPRRPVAAPGAPAPRIPEP